MRVLVSVASLLAVVVMVTGHGRLVEPPSRATGWRYGWSFPANYDDNQLFCGGFQNQLSHGMKCGVCGDPWQGPRSHEVGGKYATGTVTRKYAENDVISVSVQITANHMGWFEFSVCPYTDPSKEVTQECLDKHILSDVNGQSRFPITSKMVWVKKELRLPKGMTCERCLLQWKYNCGNSWGVDPNTKRGCVGCGPQEQFYGCSDVSIEGNTIVTPPSDDTEPPRTRPPPTDEPPRTRPPRTEPPRTRPPVTDEPPRTRPPRTNPPRTRPPRTDPPRTRPPPTRYPPAPTEKPDAGVCHAVGPWKGDAAMNNWCIVNCAAGYCPPTHCTCGASAAAMQVRKLFGGGKWWTTRSASKRPTRYADEQRWTSKRPSSSQRPTRYAEEEAQRSRSPGPTRYTRLAKFWSTKYPTRGPTRYTRSAVDKINIE